MESILLRETLIRRRRIPQTSFKCPEDGRAAFGGTRESSVGLKVRN